jgi:hypothetical protein
VAIRTLVDPADPEDVAAVNALQDRIALSAAAARPFTFPDYDAASLDRTRSGLLALAKGYRGFDRAFGPRQDVDPVRHLVDPAAGWGGLPSSEATYVNVDPGPSVGEYQLTVRDVPVDGFWSISLYNSHGYFDDDGSVVSVNNLTAQRDPDRAVTVHFGGCDDGRPNCLGIKKGWNYPVRLYRPRSEILDRDVELPVCDARALRPVPPSVRAPVPRRLGGLRPGPAAPGGGARSAARGTGRAAATTPRAEP